MKRLVRLFLFAWLVVCLPVQSAAIVSMPFCGAHGAGAAATASEDGGGVVDAGVPAISDHCAQGHGGGKPGGTASDCDRCVLCHLAGASALPSVGMAFDDSLASELRPAPSMSPTPFRPDLLDRPPAISLR